MSSPLPDGFSERRLRSEDAAAAAELLLAFDSAYLDEVTDRLSEENVRDWWRPYTLSEDSVALADERGRLAAFGLLDRLEDGVLRLQGFVHPDRAGRGLGSFLLAWAETFAQKSSGSRLRAVTVPGDATARPLVEARGFRRVRGFYRMIIDLEALPPEPDWPEGIGMAALQPGEERLLYGVMEEAFAEEWGRRSRSFEDWQKNVFGRTSFDSTLCFLARADREVVAAEMCSQRFGMGFVDSVGVRKPWRRRGLGRALLLQGFGELYQRGERRIGLGVDASNPTGATRLYERVGMRVAWQADTYEKAL